MPPLYWDPLTGKETDKVPGCVNNRKMVYLSWTGDELMTNSRRGYPRRKTTAEILAEAKARATQPPAPVSLDNLVGTIL